MTQTATATRTMLKALSIRQPFVEQIMLGEKTEEVRSWCPAYRGPILIHASKSREEEGHEGLPLGCLVGLVRVPEVMRADDDPDGLLYWILEDPIRLLRPVPYTGRVGMMAVPLDAVLDALPPMPAAYAEWASNLSRSIPIL